MIQCKTLSKEILAKQKIFDHNDSPFSLFNDSVIVYLSHQNLDLDCFGNLAQCEHMKSI